MPRRFRTKIISSSKPSTPLQHARKSEIIGCESSKKSLEKNEEAKIRSKELGEMSGKRNR